MNILDVMSEALKSERDIGETKKIEVKIPALEKEDRIANAKWERQSKFKKLTSDDDFFLDPSEGFFFHYNQKDNIYAESNASFQFIVSQGPRKREISRWNVRHAPYKFDRIPEWKTPEADQLGYGDINFRVLKQVRKINMERVWDGNRIRPNTIDDPLAFQDAIRAAIKFHPELADYTFKEKKMKMKEYLKTGPEAIEAGGEHPVYIGVKGDEAKRILKTGEIKGKVYFEKKLAYQDAKGESFYRDLYNTWAVLEINAKGKEGFGEQKFDAFEFDGKVEPKRIKLVQTNYKPYFAPGFSRPEELNLDRWPWMKKENWTSVFIARDEDDWKYWTETRRGREQYTKKRGRLKGGKTEYRYHGLSYALHIVLDTGANILVFKPDTDQYGLDKLFCYEWLSRQGIRYALPYGWQYDKLGEAAYEMIFKGNFDFEGEDSYGRTKAIFSREVIKRLWTRHDIDDIERFVKEFPKVGAEKPIPEGLDEAKSDFEKLKDNKVPLTPEERAECMKKKAVWHFHFGRDGKQHPTPAVWKSKKKDGSFVYVTNTHRAYQVRPTLRGAISIFHKFIKSTA